MAVTSLLDLRLKAGSLDAALKVIHETLAATRTFPGCLGVSVIVDNSDPEHVIAVESWESIEHDQAYRAWRATPEGASELGSILAGRPKVNQFTVAEGV